VYSPEYLKKGASGGNTLCQALEGDPTLQHLPEAGHCNFPPYPNPLMTRSLLQSLLCM
jgi:hypothetical protein